MLHNLFISNSTTKIPIDIKNQRLRFEICLDDVYKVQGYGWVPLSSAKGMRSHVCDWLNKRLFWYFCWVIRSYEKRYLGGKDEAVWSAQG